MIRWVVTGPTGAGKSALTGLLADRGAVILDGDRLGHEILQDPSVIQQLGQAFGTRFIVDGAVDRTELGRHVFADPAALIRLNGITHVPLSALASRRLDELNTGSDALLAVLEAAVYFLLPSPPRAELVVSVTASAEIRIQRLVAAGLTEDMARVRVAGQANMEPAFARADVVINNTGSLADLALWADRLLAEHMPLSG